MSLARIRSRFCSFLRYPDPPSPAATDQQLSPVTQPKRRRLTEGGRDGPGHGRPESTLHRESAMKGLRSLVLLAVLAVAAVSVADAADHHITATLSPVNGSGISGTVGLTALPHGAQIVVHAEGLTPGTQYVSLYYDNGTCELEPYSQEDVIGEYTGNSQGKAVVAGKADD